MSSKTFLYSVVTLMLALALSGCGGKPDAKAEVAKPEQPFAMREVPVAPPASEGGAGAAAAQTEPSALVTGAAGATGANAAGGGLQTTQSLRQVRGAAAASSSTSEQATRGPAPILPEQGARARLKSGSAPANTGE
jgi:hypothetical protein